MKRDVDDDVRHKRAVQGALSIGTATIGLAALGAKGGSMALKRSPKAIKALTSSKKTPKAAKSVIRRVTPDSLNSASITLTTAGAGLGGASGYHFAALQRAENKAQKEHMMVKKSAFGVVHKADRDRLLEAAGLGGAAAGIGTAIASPDVSDLLRRRSSNKAKAANMRLKSVSERASMTQMANERTGRIASIAGDKKTSAKVKRSNKAAQAAQKTAASEAKTAVRSAARAKRFFSPGKVAGAGLGLTALGVGTASAANKRRKNAAAPSRPSSGWWSDTN